MDTYQLLDRSSRVFRATAQVGVMKEASVFILHCFPSACHCSFWIFPGPSFDSVCLSSEDWLSLGLPSARISVACHNQSQRVETVMSVPRVARSEGTGRRTCGTYPKVSVSHNWEHLSSPASTDYVICGAQYEIKALDPFFKHCHYFKMAIASIAKRA